MSVQMEATRDGWARKGKSNDVRGLGLGGNRHDRVIRREGEAFQGSVPGAEARCRLTRLFHYERGLIKDFCLRRGSF